MGKDAPTAAAVARMRDSGRSWTEVADRLRITVEDAKALAEPVMRERRAALAESATAARQAAQECAGCSHRRDRHADDDGPCKARKERRGWGAARCWCAGFTDEAPAPTYPTVTGHRRRTDLVTHARIEESLAGEPTMLTVDTLYKQWRKALPDGFPRGSTLARRRRARLRKRRERGTD